jgi:hypothetical protein
MSAPRFPAWDTCARLALIGCGPAVALGLAACTDAPTTAAGVRPPGQPAAVIYGPPVTTGPYSFRIDNYFINGHNNPMPDSFWRKELLTLPAGRKEIRVRVEGELHAVPNPLLGWCSEAIQPRQIKGPAGWSSLVDPAKFGSHLRYLEVALHVDEGGTYTPLPPIKLAPDSSWAEYLGYTRRAGTLVVGRTRPVRPNCGYEGNQQITVTVRYEEQPAQLVLECNNTEITSETPGVIEVERGTLLTCGLSTTAPDGAQPEIRPTSWVYIVDLASAAHIAGAPPGGRIIRSGSEATSLFWGGPMAVGGTLEIMADVQGVPYRRTAAVRIKERKWQDRLPAVQNVICPVSGDDETCPLNSPIKSFADFGTTQIGDLRLEYFSILDGPNAGYILTGGDSEHPAVRIGYFKRFVNADLYDERSNFYIRFPQCRGKFVAYEAEQHENAHAAHVREYAGRGYLSAPFERLVGYGDGNRFRELTDRRLLRQVRPRTREMVDELHNQGVEALEYSNFECDFNLGNAP